MESFNPRARVGRDSLIRMNCQRGRGAFQSARPRGARRTHHRRATNRIVFQSARPRGARLRHREHPLVGHGVSIRAPAWGATMTGPTGQPLGSFQSARPRGARLEQDRAAPAVGMFQSARPRGARRPRQRSPGWPCRFNPRARVGRDGRAWAQVITFEVSIRAPAWGATWSEGRHAVRKQGVSIRAPAWGATPPTPAPPGTACGFNPRARVGRDGVRHWCHA